jgi:hypothetical protein
MFVGFGDNHFYDIQQHVMDNPAYDILATKKP